MLNRRRAYADSPPVAPSFHHQDLYCLRVGELAAQLGVVKRKAEAVIVAKTVFRPAMARGVTRVWRFVDSREARDDFPAPPAPPTRSRGRDAPIALSHRACHSAGPRERTLVRVCRLGSALTNYEIPN